MSLYIKHVNFILISFETISYLLILLWSLTIHGYWFTYCVLYWNIIQVLIPFILLSIAIALSKITPAWFLIFYSSDRIVNKAAIVFCYYFSPFCLSLSSWLRLFCHSFMQLIKKKNTFFFLSLPPKRPRNWFYCSVWPYYRVMKSIYSFYLDNGGYKSQKTCLNSKLSHSFYYY